MRLGGLQVLEVWDSLSKQLLGAVPGCLLRASKATPSLEQSWSTYVSVLPCAIPRLHNGYKLMCTPEARRENVLEGEATL